MVTEKPTPQSNEEGENIRAEVRILRNPDKSTLLTVDGNTLESPAPVPASGNSGSGVVDSQVTDGKLLVSNVDTEFL